MVDFTSVRVSLFPVHYNERKYSIIYMGVCSSACLSGAQHKLFKANRFGDDTFRGNDSSSGDCIAELCKYYHSDFT